ncbi:alpha-E domain-containing protein [Microlunatus speluncae]|uniref:alpha-E domain-containing protein n=1 Tax=Microlunatus speluncae TaxID=2594267 RepID=UPI001FE81D38|nr:alpha-E domain-containing protein [Microlunatus speluncae]
MATQIGGTVDPNRAGLLRRIAESVFWIGRNLERADATARILDVHLQLVLEDPWVEEDTACRSLLSIMGIQAPDDPVSSTMVLDRLAYSSEPTAIRGSLMTARENARGAREILSSEFWSAINSTWLAMPEARRMAERLGPHVYFTWIREQTSTLAGVVDLTISRDTAWRFLTLGRSLERADMTARLLLTRALPGAPGRGRPSWSALLRSCGAYEAFLRTYRGDLDEAAAVEFLLLDRLFPRSVFFALSAAEGCLNELTPGRARAGVPDLARRRLGRARTQLEFRSPEDLLGDLPTVLVDLERTCSEVSEAVTLTFFEASHAKAWAQGGA